MPRVPYEPPIVQIHVRAPPILQVPMSSFYRFSNTRPRRATLLSYTAQHKSKRQDSFDARPTKTPYKQRPSQQQKKNSTTQRKRKCEWRRARGRGRLYQYPDKTIIMHYSKARANSRLGDIRRRRIQLLISPCPKPPGQTLSVRFPIS
jgi:hypothetical protein